MSSTVTLDDISPLIRYSGPWRAGTPSSDPYFSQYSDNGTFTLTTSNAAFATVAWYGTGIELFGGKRLNHDVFSVALDGNKPRFISGEGPDLIGQSLFHVQNLEDGPHTIVIQDASTTGNPDTSFFDIDYINLETKQVSGAHSVTIDDFEPAVQYAPSSADWNTHSDLVSDLVGSSLHVTTTENATATFYFRGSAVDVYGMVCPSCGQYSVSIDDGPEDMYSAKKTVTRDNQVLYVARGLDEGVHNVRVRNLDGALGIDYATVSGTSPGGVTAPPVPSSSGSDSSAGSAASQTSTQAGPSSTAPPASSGRKFPVAETVSGILAGLLLILAIIIFVLLRQRKQRRRRPGNVARQRESIMSPVSPGALASPFMLPSSPARSVAMSSIGIHLRAPTPASLRATSPVPYALSRHSYAPSEVFGTSVSGSGMPYDQETLMSVSPGPYAPTPALVLHEAPPAYDTTSRPPSVLLRGDKKM